MPTFKAWVPGQAKESSVAGVKLTMPTGSASQLPPWELNSAAPQPFHEAQSAPIPAPPEEHEIDEELIVRTPDLPLPPEVREEAVPVGDETVLVPEETLDLGDSLELETIVPPPEPEVPLQSRKTTRAALPRPVVTPIWGPPVADELEEEEQKFAILTEDDTEAPVVGEDTDTNYIVVSPSRRGAPSASAAELSPKSAPARSSAMLLGMAAVALVAAAVVLYLFLSGGRHGVSDEGRTSAVGEGSAASRPETAPAPGREGASGGAPAGDHGAETGRAAGPADGSGLAAASGVTASAGASGPPPATGPADASAPSGQPAQAAALSVSTPVPAPPPAPVAIPAPAAPAPSAAAPTVKETTPPPAARPVPAPAKLPPPAAEVKTARLSVESIPVGATLILDGKAAGTTPRTVSTSLGRHTIRLTRDGFSAAETVVTLDSAELRKISMSLERSSAGAALTLLITSNEIGADVYVDNTRAGAAPLTLTLPPGKHAIKVAPQGKPEKEEVVNVAGDLPPNQRERKHFQF